MNSPDTAATPAAHGVRRYDLHKGLADVDRDHVGRA